MSKFLFKTRRKHKHHIHDVSDRELITRTPDASLTEALKVARTNLMYSLADIEGGKTVLITSAFSAEGKTTTCINLAATLAMTESKVLLVDADLRKPRVHAYLDVKNTEGLANYLGGFSNVENIIKRYDEFGFDYITAGSLPPNPAELFASKKFYDFVQQVKEKYDYIVFDTPPVNAVSDALSIVNSVKNVVFICRCGISATKEVSKAISSLEFAQAKVLGFITIDAYNKKIENYDTYSGYYYYR